MFNSSNDCVSHVFDRILERIEKLDFYDFACGLTFVIDFCELLDIEHHSETFDKFMLVVFDVIRKIKRSHVKLKTRILVLGLLDIGRSVVVCSFFSACFFG